MLDETLECIDFIVTPDKRHKIEGNKLFIKELKNKKDDLLKLVKIKLIDCNIIALNFDDAHSGKVFRENKNNPVTKACDAIIFCKFNNDYFVLFCELKTTYSEDKCLTQFRSSYCWVQYLSLLLEEFRQISPNWKYRYVTFHKNPFISRNTSSKPHKNDSPDSPLVLQVKNGQEVPLRELLQEPF